MMIQPTQQRRQCFDLSLTFLLLLLLSAVVQVCLCQDITTNTVIGQPLATTCPLLYTRSYIPMNKTKMNNVFYRYGIDTIDSTVSFEVTYVGLGYIGFGLSTTGLMFNATTIVGDFQQDPPIMTMSTTPSTVLDGQAYQYIMKGYLVNETYLLLDSTAYEGLPVKTVQQNYTHTVLSFTRTLLSTMGRTFGEVDFIPSMENKFIWAIGPYNKMNATHIDHGYDTIPIASNPMDVSCMLETVAVTTTAPAVAVVTTTTATPIMSVMAGMPTIAPIVAGVPSVTIVPVAPTMLVPTIDTVAVEQYDCSLTNVQPLMISDNTIAIRGIVHPKQNTITVEMIHTGLVYLSFGFSTTGKMAPATVAIGLPGTVQSSLKYTMSGYDVGTILAVPTPTPYGTITQNTTHTTLTMTRTLIEEDMTTLGAANVDLATDNNRFIWAIGGSNMLSYHPKYGSAILPLANIGTCIAIPAGVTAPTQQPIAPVAPVTTAPVAAPTINDTEVSSVTTESDELGKVLFPNLFLKLVPSTDEKSIDVILTHKHDGIKPGYLSLGVSKTGKMYPAVAIVGSSDNEKPMKYIMSGYSMSEVTLLPTDQQTLVDSTFVTNDTYSVLTYKQLVNENKPNEQIIAITEDTTFIYAIGSTPTLGNHGQQRGEFTCNPKEGTCSSGTVKKAASRETVWLVHGIVMVIAWVLLIPTAIGSSILRSLLPVGPLWFTVHKQLNQLGIMFTILGFIMSVIVVQQEGKTHFTLNSHYKIGLVIFLFAIFQALNGMYKPAAPAPPVPPPSLDITDHSGAAPVTTSTKKLKQNKNVDTDDDDEEEQEIEVPGTTIPAASNSSRTSQQSVTVQMPKKSFARISWEIYHRILGFALIGISWYNCDSGFKLYQQRYEDNYAPALWGIIGGISSLFVILYTYTKTK